MIETIPLPRSRIEAEEEFQVRVTDLTAWPDQEIICSFEHNELMDRWVWQMETEREGVIVPRSKCTLGRYYKHYPYMMSMFRDKHDTETHVSTGNLGDRVVLTVLPGPLGGSFPEGADITPAEEDELLKRKWFDPVG